MKSPIVRTWKISPRMNWPTDATFEASWATFCCASVTCFRIFLARELDVEPPLRVDADLVEPPRDAPDQLLDLVHHERDHRGHGDEHDERQPQDHDPVAVPRRHPRAASQFTAGSRANDRNNAAMSHRMMLRSCRNAASARRARK